MTEDADLSSISVSSKKWFLQQIIGADIYSYSMSMIGVENEL